MLIRLLMLQRRRRRMAAIRCLVHTQYTLDATVKGRHQHQQHQQPHDPMLLLLFAFSSIPFVVLSAAEFISIMSVHVQFIAAAAAHREMGSVVTEKSFQF